MRSTRTTATGHDPPDAAGFVAGDRPEIVTSRFRHEDSYTLDRFLATGGYDGLQGGAAARRPPRSTRRSARRPCSGAAAPASRPA